MSVELGVHQITAKGIEVVVPLPGRCQPRYALERRPVDVDVVWVETFVAGMEAVGIRRQPDRKLRNSS